MAEANVLVQHRLALYPCLLFDHLILFEDFCRISHHVEKRLIPFLLPLLKP